MKPMITQIAIGVSDLARAIEFYCEKVGFPLMFRADEHNFASLDGGGINVGLVAGELAPEANPRVAVTIHTNDIDAAYTELITRGVEFLMPPTRQPWGETMARFTDPDGNLFYLKDT